MNEHELKNLLQESTLSPSADFSQKLMREIAAKSTPVKPFTWTPFILGFACLGTVILLAFFPANTISLFNEAVQIPAVGIQLSAVLLLLYELHQILDLYSTAVTAKRMSQHRS